ncbi:hypothetical protein B0H21DRAFT_258365 [Amylocystis lapponica]|nr:hypothetical protein B0H21DRAFT_258365 [Amylocystis lapponica]
MFSDDSATGLMPLFILLAVLIVAMIGWCFLSSCLGQPLRAAVSEMWETTVMSARSGSGRTPWRSRGGWDELGEFEMEYRGRTRG